jgi:predicted nucleotide-binding protein
MKKRSAKPPADAVPEKRPSPGAPVPGYPKFSLDDALDIPAAIHGKYSGKPMPPQSLAEACGSTYGSSTWRIKLAASTAYGLTQGSYKGKFVQITDAGRSVVAPRNPEEKAQTLRDAARRPKLLGHVYDHYDSGLPDEDSQFFFNVLTRDFGIPGDDVKRFAHILRANAAHAYASIREAEEQPARESERTQPAAPRDLEEEQLEERQRPLLTPQLQVVQELRVFIGHSKNEAILDVLRTTMDLGGFKYEIAEEEETTAVPLPEKVLELMRRCSAAVINVSADEQRKRPDACYDINQNVLVEIGAAFALYPRGVVLLWDKRLPVPSNLQGLYLVQYEGENLDAPTLLRLQRAIARFRSQPGSASK